jgi:hypothetical protein
MCIMERLTERRREALDTLIGDASFLPSSQTLRRGIMFTNHAEMSLTVDTPENGKDMGSVALSIGAGT